MTSWVIFATLTFLGWGLWGFLPKFALKHLDPQSTLIYQGLGSMLVLPAVLVARRFHLQFHPAGVAFAVASGLLGALGALCFLLALSRGKVAVVVSITALYPLVTIALSMLVLQETLTLNQGIGILFALLAVLFLSR
jgi:transporter family protein